MTAARMLAALPLAMALGAGAPRASAAPVPRVTIDLDGTWEFERTPTAFAPREYSRRIPVPGLVSLALPPIEEHAKLFARPDRVEFSSDHDLRRLPYRPRYSWYRRRVEVPARLEGLEAVLTILKAKYVTQVFVNGHDVGRSIACYTPVEFPVTRALRFGQENEIVIRVGERAWLPSAAAGSTDKEKVTYLPGIWDRVRLSFTGPARVHRALVLPSLAGKKATVKLLLWSFHPPQMTYGAKMESPVSVEVRIEEAKGGRVVARAKREKIPLRHDAITPLGLEVAVPDPHPWSPDDPFLYRAEILLRDGEAASDRLAVRFGMRDFERRGRYFYLNGRRLPLRGTNITLHRFFEDPAARDLPWRRDWVRRLLAEIPRKLHWNAMRICVGIAPSLWYEVADESGLLLQNEWLYWQNHGWPAEIRREYTDWVWTDGSHPSIAIWDAINENWDEYVGRTLIPELKRLDPTRIWDAGYMTARDMELDEMDEPHPYCVYGMRRDFAAYYTRHPYPLGDLDWWPARWQPILRSKAAQLANEYGWMWLWRDGRPSKLMENTFRFYLGEEPTVTADQRRSLQAYWEELQTEWLRSERSLAGVLAFCYLTNDYGFTGDWFTGDVAELRPAPALEWFAHAFSPAAVFLDLVDERYTHHLAPHEPGSELSFDLVGVNDHRRPVEGPVVVKLLDAAGSEVARQSARIAIPPYGRKDEPASLRLPAEPGGYLLVAEFRPSIETSPSPVLSRRYVRVGAAKPARWPELEPPRVLR